MHINNDLTPFEMHHFKEEHTSFNVTIIKLKYKTNFLLQSHKL